MLALKAASKRATASASTPVAASASDLSRSRISRAGAVAGRRNSSGMGSKVSTAGSNPCAEATARARFTSAW